MKKGMHFFMTLLLIMGHSHLLCKILSPQTLASRLKTMSNIQLHHEYNVWHNQLTTPPKTFSEGIEKDITWTQQPKYKMQMFNAVVQEIANRCSQAQTIEELATVADLFFNKETRQITEQPVVKKPKLLSNDLNQHSDNH